MKIQQVQITCDHGDHIDILDGKTIGMVENMIAIRGHLRRRTANKVVKSKLGNYLISQKTFNDYGRIKRK